MSVDRISRLVSKRAWRWTLLASSDMQLSTSEKLPPWSMIKLRRIFRYPSRDFIATYSLQHYFYYIAFVSDGRFALQLIPSLLLALAAPTHTMLIDNDISLINLQWGRTPICNILCFQTSLWMESIWEALQISPGSSALALKPWNVMLWVQFCTRDIAIGQFSRNVSITA